MEIALPAADVFSALEKRLFAEFSLAAEEWSRWVTALSRWEDDELLDQPSPEALDLHRKTIERLLALGRFMSRATEQPDFPDRSTAQMVAATLTMLEDSLRMWHGPRMSKEESDRILAACFPDEPRA
jgi:hypothetical protein